MPDLWAYAIGMAIIVCGVFVGLGVGGLLWWGARLLRAMTEGQQLANAAMRREAEEPEPVGFHRG